MTKKRQIKFFFVCVAFVALTFALISLSGSFVKESMAAKASGKVIKWKLQTGFSASPQGRIYMPYFADMVRKRTGGRLEIEIIPEGTVVKALQGFDAVSRGVLDAQNYYCAPWVGKIPVALVEFGLPFSWRDGYECFDIMWNEGLIELLRKEYAKHNIFLLASFPTDALFLGTNFPIKKYEDLKGRNVCGLGLNGNWFKKVGANQVEIPYLEMYLALQQGVIKGTITALTSLTSYKVAEVIDYIYFPHPLNPDVCQIIVNMDLWNELPADIQEELKGPIARDISRYIHREFLKDDIDTIATAMDEYGVKVSTMPEFEVDKARAIAQTIWDDVARKNPSCANAVGIVKGYLRRQGVIK